MSPKDSGLGEIVTACCAMCGDGEDNYQPIQADDAPIRMGQLYRLSRWRANSRVRRGVERRRQQNGNLLCGNCYFDVTDEWA